MRILILRTSAMGDIVHSLPVLAALRQDIPDAKIGWVVEHPFAPLLQGHRDLEVVFEVELRRWRKDLREGLRSGSRVRRRIDEFNADLVLDLMGNHKAGAIAALVRAPRVLGLQREDRREPTSAMWMTETVPATGVHAVDRTLSILRGLDINPGPADFQPTEILTANEGPMPPADPYFVIQLGAGWVNKAYPTASWAEVAQQLASDTGLSGYLAYGPGDQQLAEETIASSSGGLIGSVPSGLGNLGQWLRTAKLVLGSDTGPVHLAHALGTPVLMVMGPTDPLRHGPYLMPHNTVSLELPCRACYQRFDTIKSCLSQLPANAIASRAAQLVRGRRLTTDTSMLRLAGTCLTPCG